MLYTRMDSKTYESEFKKRFTNFCEKSPMLVSFNMTPTVVQVVDESKDMIYEFAWDYTLSVKEFIHAIKEVLIKNCYPRIIKVTRSEENMPIEEQTKLAQEGMNISEIPTKRIVEHKKTFIIDKVVVYKDVFIIIDEETNESFKYHLNKSSIFFLKKIKNGTFSPTEAGSFFFEHGTLLSKIDTKDNFDEKG